MEICVEKLKKHSIWDIRKRGIYYLFNAGELVYVGQSENIYSRVLTHLTDKDFDSFSYVEIPYNESLDDIEKAEIIKHKPMYNKALYIDEFKNKLGVLFNLIRRMGHPMPRINDEIKNMNKEELIEYIKSNTNLEEDVIRLIVNCTRNEINILRSKYGPIQ